MIPETSSLAEKLLASMQADAENGFFRIDKYTKEILTDVVLYLWEWLIAVGFTLKSGTHKNYNNSIKKHLKHLFKVHSVQLHEVQLDTLTLLLTSINRSGKGKMNVMYCLHACLDFAWRSGRIQAVPPFPRRRQYGIVAPAIQWLPEERQVAIINAIDPVHQPIFWWLKYHYRRPGEAQALHKEDFDGEVFRIHRTFSDKKLVERTKTGEVHHIPCHESFKPFIEEMRKRERKMGIISPFFFVNPKGKMSGKYYTNKFLNDVWKTSCKRCRDMDDRYNRVDDEDKHGAVKKLEAYREGVRQSVRHENPPKNKALENQGLKVDSLAEVHGNRTHLPGF